MPLIPINAPSEVYGTCSHCAGACERIGNMVVCSECGSKVSILNWVRCPNEQEIAERKEVEYVSTCRLRIRASETPLSPGTDGRPLKVYLTERSAFRNNGCN